jgi:O-antigen/teichoic acid export membrane protein
MGYPKILLGVWLVTLVGDVLLNLWAIPHYGIRGAAAATSISDTVALIGVLLVVRVRYDVNEQPVPVETVV